MASDRSLAVCISLTLCGCSLSIQGPDPNRPRHLAPACDSGKGNVGLDSVMAGGLAIGGLAAIGEDAEGTGLALLAVGGLFVASAVRGNSAANECRAANAEYNVAYMRERRTPPIVDEREREPIVDERPRPRVVPRTPPAVAPAPEAPPVIANPSPEVVPATPAPPPAKQPPPADDDDWSAFWKEAP